ncbi:Permease of the drug/metabolite transporter (DMT) superfamily [Geosporobacter subterraneus DSM 17957]|uniref:Permease of the drug/metabolite transporter (DMT) superfamily n=1 Tax=Geosporobacter subterraneus DSM 17957 TaxID=1121919 RepID=A0A1M6CJR9_9FIRM|nr:DMT family transporter [Geosporobacter subterraneus]SHI61111.1 Permease of the drug/metabolite transporter (DMT) superfamily [Geosporobacter subterraneus DSM 17957]
MFNKLNPQWAVLIGVVFVSFSSIFIKYSTAPSLIIAAYRLGFTILLLLPSVIRSKGEEISAINRKSLGICILSGVFLALHFATWITSIKYTSIASSAVLVNTHPVFILLGSVLILKEKVSKRSVLCIALALTGGIIISLGDSSLGSHAIFGDMLALAGALFVAGYMMIGRAVRQHMSVTTYTFLVYASCFATLMLLVAAAGIPLYPYPIKEWFIFLALAVFCTILGHSIFNWALAYVKAAFVSTAVLGEPVFATLWAILLFSEHPTLWQILGSGLILFGIYLFILWGQEDQQNKVPVKAEQ